MERKCFCDLDGVLADFMGGICKAHGRPNPHLQACNAGEWDIPSVWKMNEVQFYLPCEEQSFWENLEEMPDMTALWQILTDTFGRRGITILTRPTRHAGAYAGKYNWVRKHLGPDIKILIGDCPKEDLVKTGRILIDDHDKNVDLWRQAGGEAIMIPRHWNRMYPMIMNEGAIHHLEKELAAMRDWDG